MQPERRHSLDRPADHRGAEPGSGLDRGFGQMLRQAGITPDLIAELAEEDDASGVTLLEQSLLDRWPVDDYADVVANPGAVRQRAEDDYRAFLEGAGAVVSRLEAFDIAGLIEIRFPVGGVQLDWRRLERCDLFLGQLWLAETRMLEWLGEAVGEVEALCRPARPWALATAACRLEAAGRTRRAAVESGDLHGYLLSLFGQAYNLEGVNVLDAEAVAIKGHSPLLLAGGAPRLQAGTGTPSQVFRTLGFSARRATAAQLRAVARLLYDLGRLEPEQFSLLSHGEWLLAAPDAARAQDWIDRFSELLAELWIRGDRGGWVESTLQLLKRAESGASAG